MKAYHGERKLKDQVLAELQAHYDANNFVKGQGQDWENGKVWAIGHLLNFKDNIEYETRLGIPIALAGLGDLIFKNLPNDKAKEFPLKFMSSFEIANGLRNGRNYSNVIWDFLKWLLSDYLQPKIIYGGKICYDAIKALSWSQGALEILREAGYEKDSFAALTANKAFCFARSAGSAAAYQADTWIPSDADFHACRSISFICCSAASAAEAAEAQASYPFSVSCPTPADYACLSVKAAAEASRSSEADNTDAAYEKFADKLIEIINKVD